MLRLPFQKLGVWIKAIDLAKKIHVLTKKFPQEEIYGLTSQMRKSSTSVPSNIAEGSQRGSSKEVMHFMLIAKGSLAELMTQIILSREFGYISVKASEDLLKEGDEIGRMLYGLHRSLISDPGR